MSHPDLDFLRTNKHHVRVDQNEQGAPVLEVDNHDLFDALEDYVTEVWDLQFLVEFPRGTTQNGVHRLHFVDGEVSGARLRELLDGI